MSSLEIKGTFIGMLAQIEDEALLRQMLEHCIELANRADALADLPDEVLQALELANQDEDLQDTIPNDAIFQQFKSWQK